MSHKIRLFCGVSSAPKNSAKSQKFDDFFYLFSLTEVSLLFWLRRTNPVMGAKKNPRKNHNQGLRSVVCAQYAQKIAKRKWTSATDA
jgi:hypothetical protein